MKEKEITMSLLRTIQETIRPDQVPFDVNESVANDLARVVTARSADIMMRSNDDLNSQESMLLAFTQIMYECDEAIEKLYKSVKKPSKVKLARFNSSVAVTR